MKKLIFLLLLCLAFGCTGNEPNPGSEPEPSEPDYGAFYEKLYSTSLVGVPKESLPDWLIFNLSELENEYSEQPDHILVRIHQGEWNDRTVYFVSKPFNSCLLCDIFYENGEKIRWMPEDSETVNFCATSKNWAFIYEFGEALDMYDFPILPVAWGDQTLADRYAALQIPNAVLPVISTEGLLETCLNYPYLLNMYLSDNFQQGFERLVAQFCGFPEFFVRLDFTNVLLKKYRNFADDIIGILLLELEYHEKTQISFLDFFLEIMLAQDTVLKNLSKEKEKQLILLSLEHKKIKQSYPNIFAGIHIVSRNLLYAKLLMNDSDFIFEDAEKEKWLSYFIQQPMYIDGPMVDFLETYINAKYIED